MAVIATGDLVTDTALSQIDSTGKFTDTITVGLGGATTKSIIFDKGGGANNPRITYNSTSNTIEIDIKNIAGFKVSSGSTVLMFLDASGNLKVKGNIEDNATI